MANTLPPFGHPSPAEIEAWLAEVTTPRAVTRCRYCGEKPAADCAEHGCPNCYTGDEGRGECEVCDHLVPLDTVFTCPNGEDCECCAVCYRCKHEAQVCRSCDRCSEHVEPDEEPCSHSYWDPAAQRWAP